MIKVQKRVPFDMCDPVGIAFYGSVYALAHRVLEEALPQLGIPWDRWFSTDKGAPVRHTECDYYHPLTANKVFDVEFSVSQMTESSVTFQYQFKEENTLYVDLRVTKVFVDRKSFKKIPIPEDLRQIFKQHPTIV